jgi:hypothetical protein
MTFTGAVVGCTPIAAGARGRARWMNDVRSTAMLGKIVRDRAVQKTECRRVEMLGGVPGQIFLFNLVVDYSWFGGLDLWVV